MRASVCVASCLFLWLSQLAGTHAVHEVGRHRISKFADAVRHRHLRGVEDSQAEESSSNQDSLIKPDMWTLFDGYNFTYYHHEADFQAANAICEAAAGSLATFIVLEEYKGVLAALVDGTTDTPAPIWLGMYADSHEQLSTALKTTTGENILGTFWGNNSTEPSNPSGECVAVSTSTDPSTKLKVWDSYDCKEAHRFMCKASLYDSQSPSPSNGTPAPPSTGEVVRVMVYSTEVDCMQVLEGLGSVLKEFDLGERLVGDQLSCQYQPWGAMASLYLDTVTSGSIFITILRAGGISSFIHEANVPCGIAVAVLPEGSLDSPTTFNCEGIADGSVIGEYFSVPALCCGGTPPPAEESSEESSEEESSTANEESHSQEPSIPPSPSNEKPDDKPGQNEESSSGGGEASDYEKSDDGGGYYEESSDDDDGYEEQPASITLLVSSHAKCTAALAVSADALRARDLTLPEQHDCEVLGVTKINSRKLNYLNITMTFASVQEVADVVQQMLMHDLAGALSTALGAPCGSLLFYSLDPASQKPYRGLGCLSEASLVDQITSDNSTWTNIDCMCCGITESPPAPSDPVYPAGAAFAGYRLSTTLDCDQAAAGLRAVLADMGVGSAIIEPLNMEYSEIYVTNQVLCQEDYDELMPGYDLSVVFNCMEEARHSVQLLSQGWADVLVKKLQVPCGSQISAYAVDVNDFTAVPSDSDPRVTVMGCDVSDVINATAVYRPTMCCKEDTPPSSPASPDAPSFPPPAPVSGSTLLVAVHMYGSCSGIQERFSASLAFLQSPGVGATCVSTSANTHVLAVFFNTPDAASTVLSHFTDTGNVADVVDAMDWPCDSSLWLLAVDNSTKISLSLPAKQFSRLSTGSSASSKSGSWASSSVSLQWSLDIAIVSDDSVLFSSYFNVPSSLFSGYSNTLVGCGNTLSRTMVTDFATKTDAAIMSLPGMCCPGPSYLDVPPPPPPSPPATAQYTCIKYTIWDVALLFLSPGDEPRVCLKYSAALWSPTTTLPGCSCSCCQPVKPQGNKRMLLKV